MLAEPPTGRDKVGQDHSRASSVEATNVEWQAVPRTEVPGTCSRPRGSTDRCLKLALVSISIRQQHVSGVVSLMNRSRASYMWGSHTCDALTLISHLEIPTSTETLTLKLKYHLETEILVLKLESSP